MLIEAVRSRNEKLKMPPDDGERLSAQQVGDLEQWIRNGADWPQPAMVLFDDEPVILDALSEGSGPKRLDRDDRHLGEAALVVTPQRFAAKIDGWNFPIAETPGPGEYRYLRFAWRKRGGGAIMFELANNGQWRTEKQTSIPDRQTGFRVQRPASGLFAVGGFQVLCQSSAVAFGAWR